MGLMAWLRRLDSWRSKKRHMWQQRTERECLLKYIDTADMEDSEDLKAMFSQNRLDRLPVYPYMWARESNFPVPEVYFDESRHLHYVDWNGKKLYWKRDTSKETVADIVRFLKIEQHEKSPHRYEMPEYLSGGVVADIGTADGCFALDIIDRARYVYLFECDEAWMEALEATFAPWKDKVFIVNKFVGAGNGGDYVTLDTFFSDKSLDFIKADIEGAEMDMLSFGEDTLRRKVRGVNVCLYHRATDEENILGLLHTYGYTCNVNPGHMFFYKTDIVGQHCENPKEWLRRGVVRAERKTV